MIANAELRVVQQRVLTGLITLKSVMPGTTGALKQCGLVKQSKTGLYAWAGKASRGETAFDCRRKDYKMEKFTHWKKAQNTDYIGEWAFQPGEQKIVTIDYARHEMFVGMEGKKESGLIVHFVEPEKPLICNATNAKQISKLCGSSYIEHWKGQRIILKIEKIKAFGDLMMAVRVSKEKAPAPTVKQPDPVCEDCKKKIPAVGSVSSHNVAAQTKAKFGAVLCYQCGKIRAEKEAANVKQEETANESDA